MKTIKTQCKCAYKGMWRLLPVLLGLLVSSPLLYGQVTIGDGTPPQEFSILEIVSSGKGGLRMPRLTTAQRNTLTASAAFQGQKHQGDPAASLAPGLALGLTIYNTDTNCAEYWDGKKWNNLCQDMLSIPSINKGTGKAVRCAGNDLTLEITNIKAADISAAEWYFDDETTGLELVNGDPGYVVNQNKLTIPAASNKLGYYIVRYQDNATGYWSSFSSPIRLIESGTITLKWIGRLEDEVVKGDGVLYNVRPEPDTYDTPDYKWSYTVVERFPAGNTDDPVEKITDMGDGSALVVYSKFSADSIKIKLKVETVDYPCGDESLETEITIKDGCIQGTSLNIFPAAGTTVKVSEGEKYEFRASTDASNIEDDRWFRWFVVPAGTTPDYLNNLAYKVTSDGKYSHKFDDMGMWDVHVLVINKCTDEVEMLTVKGASVSVQPDFSDIDEDQSGQWYISGKYCYDIATHNMAGGSAQGSFWGNEDDRKNGTFKTDAGAWIDEHEYVFNGAGFYNLTFMVDDSEGLVKSFRQGTGVNQNKFYLTFNQDKLYPEEGSSAIITKDRSNPLTLKVLAAFTTDLAGANRYKVGYSVNVQNCECSCVLKESASGNGWRKVQCHNLGADETINPLDVTNPIIQTGVLNGNYYQWGKKDPVADAHTAAGAIPGWNTTPASGTEWESANDPCPEGWSVPTQAEWQEFINYSTSVTRVGTWTNSATNYTAGVLWGTAANEQYVFLPAAGERRGLDGSLPDRGNFGGYWSGTTTQNTSAMALAIFQSSPFFEYYPNNLRTAGLSVRCIEDK